MPVFIPLKKQSYQNFINSAVVENNNMSVTPYNLYFEKLLQNKIPFFIELFFIY